MTRRAAPALVLLIAAACAVRYAAWLRLGGPITAVDSITYRTFAQAIAQGDLSEFGRLALYLLYPLTLAPLYVFSLPEAVYIQWLHVLASTATVWLMARTAARLISERAGILTGAAAAVYPFFLFWLPYVLTETLFLLCLAAYVHACLRLLDDPRPATAVPYALICVPFLFSRPSAIVCILFSWLVLGAATAARRWGVVKGAGLTAALALVAAAAAAGVVVSSAAVRDRILSMPTIGQTLWASTKYSTGNLEDLRRLEALDQEMHARFQGPDRERNEYAFKVREAAAFIAGHPVEYAGMVARRAVAYWFPWAFATSWSAAHRALDAAVSIGLAVGVLMALKRRALAPWPLAALGAMASAFALLSAFGQIDPDARYRLPVELLALILASGAFVGREAGRPADRAVVGPTPKAFSPTMHPTRGGVTRCETC